MSAHTIFSFVAAAAFCGTVFSGIAACGPAEKKSAAHQNAHMTDNETYSEEEPACEVNGAPVITNMHLNDEAFCAEGIAHVIIDAEDSDGDQLEYHLRADGAEVERDWESPEAFYLSGLKTGNRHTVRVIAGDGCAVAIKNYELSADEICSASADMSAKNTTAALRAPDEPYIELSPYAKATASVL